jgi:hypothetical protein
LLLLLLLSVLSKPPMRVDKPEPETPCESSPEDTDAPKKPRRDGSEEAAVQEFEDVPDSQRLLSFGLIAGRVAAEGTE